jgi:hypothetical protein
MRFALLTLTLLLTAGCSGQNPTTEPAPIVQDMIADITIPESLDAGAFPKGNEDSDRYQLGLQVTRTITCTWLDQWVQAISADDQANINGAEQAMNDSHDWAILNEMSFTGDWPKAIWIVADAMNSDSKTLNSVPIADTYQTTLGCPD